MFGTTQWLKMNTGHWNRCLMAVAGALASLYRVSSVLSPQEGNPTN